MPEIEFVLAPRQNAFFAELATTLRDELRALGVAARVSPNGFSPARPNLVHVLIPPHEYVGLSGGELPSELLRRTIFVCAEPPGSAWFEGDVRLAGHAGAIFDINAAAVEHFRALGIAAEYLPLGYTAGWDRFDPDAERDIDIAFLGCATLRRSRILAGQAPALARHRCELVISDNDSPNPATSASFVAGEDKWALLGRSKLLLNLHRDDFSPYFEWVRILEAIHCGAVVVSERSAHFAPLEPGRHFVSGDAENLVTLAEELLAGDERRRRMQLSAHDFIRERLPLRDSAALLATAAERLAGGRGARRRPLARLSRARATPPEPSLHEVLEPLMEGRRKTVRSLARVVKQTRLDTVALGRRIAELERAIAGEAPTEVELRHQTGAWESAGPRVSVIVPAYNQAEHVRTALDSVERSRYRDFELVVVDDASTDLTGDVAEAWMRDHDHLPALLLRHPINRGLPATRNAAIRRARGELVLPLDSDNELFASCLERLVVALDADPEAAFAYGLLQGVGPDGPETVFGYYGWEPERLTYDNYIDALALMRRVVFDRVGGYATEPELHGWEDYDLWCTLADRGMRAAHVREFVARYRIDDRSMIQLTGISTEDAKARLVERHPRLFAEAAPFAEADPLAEAAPR